MSIRPDRSGWRASRSPCEARRVKQGWRWLGLALFLVILARVNFREVLALLGRTDLRLIALAVAALPPLILLKALRWRILLAAQGARYGTRDAFLAYFASLAVGFLTPGRLGEFVKALYASRDCGLSSGRAFSSVLADRLFDLYFISAVGVYALIRWRPDHTALWGLFALVLVLPLPLFLHGGTFAWVQRAGQRAGRFGARIFAPGAWLPEMREGLVAPGPAALSGCLFLTVVSYVWFFAQCLLVARAVHLPLGYVDTALAMSLAGLVTLIPVSISGLGTRDATLIAYLALHGIPAESALAFSLWLFLALFVAGAGFGAGAAIVKPLPARD